MGKIGKILGWTLIVLGCILMTAYLIVQIPYVQTKLSKYVLEKFTNSIDADITLSKVEVRFFNRLHVEDFAIISGDTLVYAKDLDARFSLRGLLDKSKALKSVSVSNGVFKLISETDSTTNLSRIFPPSDDSSPLELDAALSSLSVENFRFCLIDPFNNKGAESGQINFSDLDVYDINLQAKDLSFTDGIFKGNLEKMSAKEKSGFCVGSISGNLLLDSGGATLYNPDIQADGSHFSGEYLKIGFNEASDLKYFLDKVNLQAKFKNTKIALRTIGRFAPKFLSSDMELLANGEVSGTVRNLTIKTLDAVSKSGQTLVSLNDLRLKGLPDIEKTTVSGNIRRLSTNGPDLSDIVAGLTGGQKISFLSQLPPMQTWNYSGTLNGTLAHLVTDGVLSTEASTIKTNVAVNVLGKGTEPLVACNVDVNDFNLRQFTGSPMLGLFSGKGRIRVDTSSGNSTSIAIDSLNVRKIGINGYNLGGLFAKGVYSDDVFDGKIICHDPALDLMFQGNIATSLNDGSVFNFYANIPYADLKALNIDTREGLSEISTFISADLFSDSESNIFGYLKMDNTSFTNSHGKQYIGNLDATSLYEDGKYVINIVSDFLKARYEGTQMIDSFIYQFRHQVLRRHFSNLLKPYNQTYANETYGQQFNLTLKTLNTQGICAFIMPGLYIQNGTSLRINVNENDHYRITANSGRLAWENNYLKNVRLNISDRDSIIGASLFSREIVAAGFAVDSTRMIASIQNNKVDLGLQFHNDSTLTNLTNLNAVVSILRDTILTANGKPEHLTTPIAVNFKESDITLRGNKWRIRPSELVYSDSLIIVDGFRIENSRQLFLANGTLSSVRKDSLGITTENFDISIFDQFLDNPLGLGGKFSGNARISLNKDDTKMFAAFRGDSVMMNNYPVGNMDLNANWSAENQRYDIGLTTHKDGTRKLNLGGWYRPSDSYVSASSDLNELGLKYFEPFLEGVASDVSGTISGKVNLNGPIDDLSLSSTDCNLNKLRFKIDFLQVPLTIDGPFKVNDNGIQLKNCKLADTLGGSGRVNGGITYNKFKDIKVGVGITLNNVLSLNTDEADNEDFYGKVFASGNVNIKGDLKHLVLDVNATTERKTMLHIPLSGASSASSSDILTFRQEEKPVEIDPYDTLFFARKTKVSEPMELEVNLNANATSDASVWLEIDKSTGDILKAKGNGRLGIKVNPSKNIFRLSGNYTIDEGSYHFVLMGLASRDFTVQPGSNVTLNGKIGNTALDIEALYTTKTSIERLISDSTAVGTSRLVNASIKITGILDNPQIKFGIDIPDLDPTTKLQVDNALNSEDKIQKQFASLIAFGSFTPETDSGISSGSSAIYANATSMIVGQVNNLLMQLGIPLDLGFNYQQGSEYINDAYEVAVSTQLFNNRVIINGSMGNNPYASWGGTDVRGNIDIQVKIDRRGNVRMTFFSHATDLYSSYLDMSQRTGMGVAYQHEFNSFKDLFRKRTPAQKEYDRRLSIKEKEERKAARQRKKEEKKKAREESRASSED